MKPSISQSQMAQSIKTMLSIAETLEDGPHWTRMLRAADTYLQYAITAQDLEQELDWINFCTFAVKWVEFRWLKKGIIVQPVILH